jgi:hypothetical protein
LAVSPAGWRFFNPGDISFGNFSRGFGAVRGASIPGQNIAVFSNWGDGYAAFTGYLDKRIGQGYDTIAKLNPVYATDTNWKNGVAKFSGIGINDPLTPGNRDALAYGIMRQEGFSKDQVATIQAAAGVSGKTPSVADAAHQPGELNKGETGFSFFDQGETPGAGPGGATPKTPGGGATPATPGGGSSGAGKGIVSGSWEMTGSTAVTTGANTVAESNKQLGGDVKSTGAQVGADVKSAASSLSEGINKAEQAALAGGTGWLQDTFDNLKNLFTRGILGFFGLILILGAALYWSRR